MVADAARTWGARILQPVARWLHKAGLSPNTVTIIGFLLTVVVSIILATGHLRLAGFLYIITTGLDAIDGTLARLSNQVTRFGAFLDSTLDRWSEIAMYGALIWYFLRTGVDSGVLLAFAALAGSLMVSYTRARAEGVGIPCKEGLLTRFERLVIIIAGLVFGQVIWALAIVAILAGVTALQRIWMTWRAEQAGR